MYAGKCVCVTGGAGFIGGHLVDTLVSAGAAVHIIDDLSNATLDALSDHIELLPDRVRFIYGSILDDRALAEAIQGSEIVFHLAAMGSVPRSMDEPARTFEVNADGTLRVLDQARKAGVQRVMLAASSSAYGDPETLPCEESMPAKPASPYAASKLAAEHLAKAWSNSFNLSTVSLRYFNIFGPRQSADSAYAAVIAAFAKRLLSGQQPVIFGDGHQSRDFTFVSNAVYATLLAGACEHNLSGEVINIGTGGSVSLIQLAETMSTLITGHPVEPIFDPPRAGDVRDSRADISLARKLIGYEPIASVDAGLEQTCRWYASAIGAKD
ncbi:MAG TPA: NAD-dependent epimerase/dehydratase family protein [Phycisphaerales bacterium]|nr:NAD-dependent epimerase/dehydratase family protein [Phycisphaerales bacterium]